MLKLFMRCLVAGGAVVLVDQATIGPQSPLAVTVALVWVIIGVVVLADLRQPVTVDPVHDRFPCQDHSVAGPRRARPWRIVLRTTADMLPLVRRQLAFNDLAVDDRPPSSAPGGVPWTTEVEVRCTVYATAAEIAEDSVSRRLARYGVPVLAIRSLEVRDRAAAGA